jgi:hypothetical protein
MDYLNIAPLNLLHWILIFLFLSLAGLTLLRAVKEFEGKTPVIDNNEKLRRSIRTALWIGGCWVSSLLALFVYYWANIGFRAAISVSLLIGGCTLPLIILVCIVGSYVHLTWVQGLQKTLDYIGEKEKRRQEHK